MMISPKSGEGQEERENEVGYEDQSFSFRTFKT
jgi:hypothetical protein